LRLRLQCEGAGGEVQSSGQRRQREAGRGRGDRGAEVSRHGREGDRILRQQQQRRRRPDRHRRVRRPTAETQSLRPEEEKLNNFNVHTQHRGR